MSSEIVLIIASDCQENWDFSTPKPLSNLGRETVLGRLQRQLKELGYTPVVKTNDIDIMAASDEVCITGDQGYIAIISGNSVYFKNSDLLQTISGHFCNAYFINSTNDYWTLVREVINVGKLNPTE